MCCKQVSGGDCIYLLLYVDDMPIACKQQGELEKIKILLKSEFQMKEMGPAKKILEKWRSLEMSRKEPYFSANQAIFKKF